MKKLNLNDINKAVSGNFFGRKNVIIDEIIIDSRTVFASNNAIFFAIKGRRHNGHDFIFDLMKKGIKNFVVSSYYENYFTKKNTNFILVKNTIEALQKLSKYIRKQFDNEIVAIAGSNGKTITKEWLFELLHKNIAIVRNPKSYNSQIGVPLSVCLLENKYNLAIFEAGISKFGEMQKLEKIIKPETGIFTNISNAHQENFPDLKTKTAEKLKLFKSCKSIIYCSDYKDVDKIIKSDFGNKKLFAWSHKKNADLKVIKLKIKNKKTEIKTIYKKSEIKFSIPFTDKASIDNAITCLAYIIFSGKFKSFNLKNFEKLSPVEMRLELKSGINNCTLINDSYNSDINSLKIALGLLENQKQHSKKTVILSDILQSGLENFELYSEIAQMMTKNNICRFIGIGKNLLSVRYLFNELPKKEFYTSTNKFLRTVLKSNFIGEAILIKGSRSFTFEKISEFLQQKNHRTVLEINLKSIIHNLNFFSSLLSPETKIMVMVKAFSYGNGTYEIANLLQNQRVDYLGVAYTDEGVKLRKSGISLPIMIMNPDTENLRNIIDYKLEPEIYSFSILKSLSEKLRRYSDKKIPVHLKIETGMHRLGFCDFQIDLLISKLKKHNNLIIKSVFSHLAAGDEILHDDFTKMQIHKFTQISNRILQEFNYPILRHILNSSGIERFSFAEFDMVRLGIGLYGFSSNNQDKLMNVSCLKSRISQIKYVKSGETIGYGRKEKVDKDLKIAIVPIGYADGLSRSLSNRKGKVIINGKFAEITGNICMDMFMADISGINASEGDEVIIFGDKYTAGQLAETLNTIPYEIITGISERVKRIYFR